MSAAPWLSDSGWTRLSELATSRTSNVDKHSIDGQIPVRLCNYVDVYKNDRITGDLTFMAATATADQVEAFRIQRGDTIITKDSETADDIGVPAFVDYAPDDLVCGYHLSIIRPRADRAHPRFLYWVMSAQPTMEQWAQRASGVTRVGLKAGDIAKVRLPLCSLDRQRLVADYLDCETAQIDRLIEKQKLFIATLLERQVAERDFAVGSDKTVPLRRLADVIDCAHVTATFVDDDVSHPVVSIRELGGTEIDFAGCKYTTEPDFALLREGSRTPRANDLLFVRNVSVGLVSIVRRDTRPFAVGQETVLIRPKEDVHPDFLRHALMSSSTTAQLEAQMIGSTFRRINVSGIRALRLPIKDFVDQEKLVNTLNEREGIINRSIERAEQLIELSRERRSALITAAVTGQIDVRGAA